MMQLWTYLWCHFTRYMNGSYVCFLQISGIFLVLFYVLHLKVLWCCWLGDKKGIRPGSDIASNPWRFFFDRPLGDLALSGPISRKIDWLNKTQNSSRKFDWALSVLTASGVHIHELICNQTADNCPSHLTGVVVVVVVVVLVVVEYLVVVFWHYIWPVKTRAINIS